MTILVRSVRPSDHDAWQRLFRAYRAFYLLQDDEAVVARVWSWLLDEGHEVHGLVAAEGDVVVGLAHWRRFARPSTGTVGIWLDDLFTDEAARGSGVGRALIAELQRLAHEEGRSVVRWITADDNHRAHRLYDDVATRTSWVTYDAPPAR